MRKILLSVVLATSLAFTSCQYDDSDIWGKLDEYGESIKDHEERISTLEELCKQMNTNISAMQSIIEALENCDYIINVSPIYKDGEEIGYTISFAYSGTITIYHGIDGADGKNGDAPQIGVKKDADGIYYWTLDGEWMLDANGEKIKAVGIDGKDGQNGQDGANGSNGSNGTNGNDGITPRLKIENDYWYVSYDNGTTWVQLGKATGENGKDGNDGINSIIIGVEESETEVVFILSDNTTITIPKHSKSSLVDPDDICSAMDDVKFMEYCYQNFDVNKDGKVSPFEAKAVRNIDISGLDIYSINGVEYFEILESLKAENTPLRNIDISYNNKLISFSFKNCSSITSVALPNNITTIGVSSFFRCSSLTNITIPDSVTSIGEYAFEGCSNLEEFKGKFASSDGRCLILSGVLNHFAPSGLTKYSIPNSVTSIGKRVFINCSNLMSITIPENVTSIGEHAFEGYSGKLIINSKVVEIDYNDSYPISSSGWLYGSKFSELIVGSNVEKIGSSAFRGCNSLTSITISNSVTSIGENAFRGCGLTSVTIPDSVTSIGESAFCDCSNLTSVTIPDSVTSIGKSAFGYCSGKLIINSKVVEIEYNYNGSYPMSKSGWLYGSKFSELIVGSNVEKIGNYAFRGCNSLTSITIPNSVTSIGSNAFSGCSSLTSITIPDSVTSIGNSAFSGCNRLKSVIIPDSVTSIGNGAFYDCSSLASVVIPNSITSIGEYAFYNCSNLTSITIPDSITSIGANAFEGCSKLTSVNIPDSVTSIGSLAFKGCSSLEGFKGKFASSDGRCLILSGVLNYFAPAGLTKYTIPDSVTTIGISAFDGCSNLTSVTIPNSVTSIGNWAFKDCNSLTSVTISDSVTLISTGAFSNCSSLKSVTIPNSVTSIGTWAFKDCNSLTSIYCKPVTPPAAEMVDFLGPMYNYGLKIYVPMTSLDTYKKAWSDNAEFIEGYEFE